MNKTIKEQAKETIQELVTAFQKNEHELMKASYDETQVRQEFIDKFFIALGWDVGNKQNQKQKLKDVVLEYKQRIVARDGSISNKKPDYAFRVNGKVKFFVEAKAPHVDLATSESAIFQVRNYGYHKRLAISVLTDFQELYIYDTKISLRKKIQPLKTYKYTDYIANFDEIWDCLSREAIENENSIFSQWQKGIAKDSVQNTIDSDFLEYLNEFRESLAKNIAKNNTYNDKIAFNEYDFNYIVQKIIDRIIFLRIAEARSLEHEDTLKTIANSNNAYNNLNKFFITCQDRYNSDLFPSEDPKKSQDTQLFDSLKIDDSIFKTYIVKRLYDENYWLFEIIPVEILGSIYEHFLGKTIYVTDKRVKIEEKPEVKKAKGIYYTPQYIVEYIVKNTIGVQIEKQNYKKVDLSILDSACGSGAFLLGAYEYLLAWYLEQYTLNPSRITEAKKDNKIYEKKNTNAEIEYYLHISERKHILEKHIHGVDIDHQAVEMAKLSLILKMMENASVDNDLYHVTEKVKLPDLSKHNVKCGNSLINQYDLYDKDSDINILDWDKMFKPVFELGGFTTIIGNPPYVKEYTSTEPFLFKNCESTKKYYEGKMDLWYAFTCLALEKLLRPNGLHSYIATNNWNTAGGASILRKSIFTYSSLLEYIDFADYKVFSTASIQTMIFILKKETPKQKYHFDYKIYMNKKITPEKAEELLLDNESSDIKTHTVPIDCEKIIQGELLNFQNDSTNKILDRIQAQANYYLDDKEVAQGIVPALDECFIVTDKNKFTKQEQQYIKPYYTHCERYYTGSQNDYLIYLSANNFIAKTLNMFSNFKNHFEPYKKILKEAKIKYKTPDKPYFFLHREREERLFLEHREKIICQIKTAKPKFYYTTKAYYCSRALNIIQPNHLACKYLVGILNSSLVAFWLKSKSRTQGTQLQVDKAPLLQIPLINSPEHYSIMEKLVTERIDIETNYKNIENKTPSIINKYDQQVENLESQINKLVYTLYKLSAEEIAIVEGGK